MKSQTSAFLAQTLFISLFIPFLTTSFTYTQGVDLIVFSFNRPLQLYAFLESTMRNVRGLAKKTVIYRTKGKQYEKGYRQVKQRFKGITYIHQSIKKPQHDFKPHTIKAMNSSPAPYILFAVDDIIVTEHINLDQCAQAMETYHAYGFYLRLGLNTTECYMLHRHQGIPPMNNLGNDLYSWHFKDGQADWEYPNSVDMTLYRKRDIAPQLNSLAYHSPNSLEGSWNVRGRPNMNSLGLCFSHSKIVNIPINLVGNTSNHNIKLLSPGKLLSLFNKRKKMDIGPLQGIKNNSAHIKYRPRFIKR